MLLQLGYLWLWEWVLITIFFCWNNVVVIEGQECVSTIFDCGNIKNMGYPFWYLDENGFSLQENYCGYQGFGINCSNGNPILELSNTSFYVTSFTEQSLSVIDLDFMGESCPRVHRDYEFHLPFYSDKSVNRVVKYYSNCALYPPSSSVPYISCLDSTASKNRSYLFESDAVPNFNWDKNCEDRFQIPVLSTAPNISKDVSNYGSILQLGFILQWQTPENCVSCEDSGGKCGFSTSQGGIVCEPQGTKTVVVISNHTSTIGTISSNHTRTSRNHTRTAVAFGVAPPAPAVAPAVARTDACSCTRAVAPTDAPAVAPTDAPAVAPPVVVDAPAVAPPEAPPVVVDAPAVAPPDAPAVAPAEPPVVAGSNHTRTKIIGVSGVATLVLIILLVYIFVYKKKMYSRCCQICKWNNQSKQNTNVEVFLEDYGRLAPYRYRYSELKRITNFFKDKLGQGGYGGVFKGKLKDGQLVAVKVLTESKGNGDEFINEVATIGRTNHVNIVSLLGYCSQGPKRALVYEFMPNGSLEKFIYNEKSASTTHPLGWEKLYQIALGIASGLEYLHRGCNTRILHFDIKPHNILLDEDFCPKISDFGLAKLCPTKDSIVSMFGTRGTIGYIAPEVYCRNFGGVSPKSDVYSYGMMVLEMVGGRKNIDVTVENISEIYFPQWIYNHLEQHGSIGLGRFREMFEEESTKKMIIVGLWCIQTHPADRPSMSTVVEMLQKSVEDLKMPPNPFQGRESSQSTS